MEIFRGGACLGGPPTTEGSPPGRSRNQKRHQSPSTCDVASPPVTRGPPWGRGSAPAYRVGADHSPPPHRPRSLPPRGCQGRVTWPVTRSTPETPPHIGVVGAVTPIRGPPPLHTPPPRGCPGSARLPTPSCSHETFGRASPPRTSAHSPTSHTPRRDPLPPHSRVATPRGVRRPLHPSTPRQAAPLPPPRGARRFQRLLTHAGPLSPSHCTTSRPPPPPRGARHFRILLAHAGPPARREPGGCRTPPRPCPRSAPRWPKSR